MSARGASVFFLLLLLCSACTTRKEHESNLDEDGDGYQRGEEDCDDANPHVYQGAEEVCDGLDNDCDLKVDEGIGTTWYRDEDGDQYGREDETIEACEAPAGWVGDASDCDDQDATVHPDAGETCGNGVDDDCDGEAPDCGPWGEMSVSEADAVLVGEMPGSYFGGVVDGAGDVNKDGFDDLLALAPCSGDLCNEPSVYLVCGPVSGRVDLSNATARLTYRSAEEYAGLSVSSAGDVDGDEYADLLVGVQDLSDNETGAVYFVTGPVSGNIALLLDGAQMSGETDGDAIGVSVSTAGDVDGDGLADILVGAIGVDAGGDQAGAAYLAFGPISGQTDLSSVTKFIGESSGDFAGNAVAEAGDVNGDGFADILIGAYTEASGGERAGAAYLILGPVSGERDLESADAKLIGEDSADYFGGSLSTAGDVNGDGKSDLLVGAWGYNNESGAAYLVLGPVLGELDASNADAWFVDDADNTRVGQSVDTAGDVDGDGRADLLIGAPLSELGGYTSGATFVVFGPVSGEHSLSQADITITGETGDWCGRALSAAGNVNGDAFSDFLIGVPDSASGGGGTGAVYLFYGGAGL